MPMNWCKVLHFTLPAQSPRIQFPLINGPLAPDISASHSAAFTHSLVFGFLILDLHPVIHARYELFFSTRRHRNTDAWQSNTQQWRRNHGTENRHHGRIAAAKKTAAFRSYGQQYWWRLSCVGIKQP
uniref:Uncharacterized protein n=1 Tax=mine drainage metagenome TaxID=410659 RepID=E6QWE5_9ZZZZ